MTCAADVSGAVTAVDVLKSAIGPFLGAGAAFALALWRDRRLRIRDRKAAGNMAVLTLLRQTNDYLTAATTLRTYRDWLLKQQPSSPPWMLMKPMHFDHSDALRFRMDSLVFLLERPAGEKVIEALLTVEMQYHALFGMLKVHAETSEALQVKLSDSDIDPRQGVRVADLELVAGFQLVAKTQSFVHGIFECIDRDESKFPRRLRSVAACAARPIWPERDHWDRVARRGDTPGAGWRNGARVDRRRLWRPRPLMAPPSDQSAWDLGQRWPCGAGRHNRAFRQPGYAAEPFQAGWKLGWRARQSCGDAGAARRTEQTPASTSRSLSRFRRRLGVRSRANG
jgi:hypothetical protein